MPNPPCVTLSGVPRKPQHRRLLSRLAPGVLVALIIIVPLSYVLAPHLKRWTYIHWLTSQDTSHRNRALSYMAAHAGDDERVLAGAVSQLNVEDDANFQQIVDALQAAGRWDLGDIPHDAWLRWIGLLAREPGVEAPARAAQRLANLQDLADDPRVVRLLTELLIHPQADVRYNALCAVGELYRAAKDPSTYQDFIRGQLDDAEPVIVHHAHLFAYLTGTPDVEVPTWLRNLPEPPVDPQYDIQAIDNLLRSPVAALRDVGCVLAVRNLSPDDVDTLTAELLRDTDAHARMAGAILSGVTGRQTDVLRQSLVQQTDWVTATVMRLGLWMQGRDTEQIISPLLLLARPDIPRTTLIFAMMHHNDPLGLEALLSPQGEAPDDLARLFDDYGWWRVLDRYLPEDAPRWRSGTRAEQQQLQIDLLRDWYLVNRHRLKNDQAVQ